MGTPLHEDTAWALFILEVIIQKEAVTRLLLLTFLVVSRVYSFPSLIIALMATINADAPTKAMKLDIML